MATSTFDIGTLLPATLTAPGLSERGFLDLCQQFPDATLEYEPDGTVLIMPPTDLESGMRLAAIIYQLKGWSRQLGNGNVVGSAAGFFLPGGSRRSPDAAWFDSNRWKAAKVRGLSFPVFAPDFVIELRSPHDRLAPQARKMQEYIENGVKLGWLIDPQNRTVTVYRPGEAPTVLANPAEVAGEGPVEGFVLSLAEIFQP